MKISMRKTVSIIITMLVLCSQMLLSGCAVSRNLLGILFKSDTKPVVIRPVAAGNEAANPGIKERYRLARHFQQKGRHDLTVQELHGVIRLDPNHAPAHNALGVSYDRLRRFGPAQLSYRAALDIDSTLDYVYNNLGYSYLLQGDLAAAETAFETAVALNSRKKRYQNNLALVQARQGRQRLSAASTEPAGENGGSTLPAAASDLSALADRYKEVFTVQLGVYYERGKALQAVKDAQKKGFPGAFVTRVDRADSFKPYYRVRAGQFQTRTKASEAMQKMGLHKKNTVFVVMETLPKKNTLE